MTGNIGPLGRRVLITLTDFTSSNGSLRFIDAVPLGTSNINPVSETSTSRPRSFNLVNNRTSISDPNGDLRDLCCHSGRLRRGRGLWGGP